MSSTVVAAIALAAGVAAAERPRAGLITSRVVWDQAPRNLDADLVRFKDRWFIAFVETADDSSHEGAVRVLTSEDGGKWESAALLTSPTPDKAVSGPRLAATPGGRLVVTAHGVVSHPTPLSPVPRYGGTVATLAWSSADGRVWGKPQEVGWRDFPLGRAAWNEGEALAYGRGCICGSVSTVRFFASRDGRGFDDRYDETFSGFFPGDAALVFDGGRAHCLMSRVSSTAGNRPLPALLGAAKAPFGEWEWKETTAAVRQPNLLRLPDGRVIAAVGFAGGKPRTAVCELDLATGKLTELLELATNGTAVHAGLAAHDGRVWAAYAAPVGGKWGVHFAGFRLP